MNKYAATIVPLAERIRRNMETLWVALGGFLFPLGLSLLVVGQDKNSGLMSVIGICVSIIGVVMWVKAFYEIRNKDARTKAVETLSIAHLMKITTVLEDIKKRLPNQPNSEENRDAGKR